jgi:hypothetical protein
MASERALCGFLMHVCRVLAILAPAGFMFFFAVNGTKSLALAVPGAPATTADSLSAVTSGVAFSIALLPLLASSRAIWIAAKCFKNFAHGEYINRENTTLFRDFARWMLWAALLHVLMTPALSALISIAQTNSIAVSLSITSQDTMLAIFAGLVWAASRVFAQATALAEENAQFI